MKKRYFILIVLICIMAFTTTLFILHISPQLVSGKIVEVDGIITEIESPHITIKTDSDIYRCRITNKTFFREGYIPAVGDSVVAIYDLTNPKITNGIKNVTIGRIYKKQQATVNASETSVAK